MSVNGYTCPYCGGNCPNESHLGSTRCATYAEQDQAAARYELVEYRCEGCSDPFNKFEPLGTRTLWCLDHYKPLEIGTVRRVVGDDFVWYKDGIEIRRCARQSFVGDAR